MRIAFITLLASVGALRLAIPHSKTSHTSSLDELNQQATKNDFDEWKAALKRMEPYVMLRDYKNVHTELTSSNNGAAHTPSKVLVGEDSPPIRPYKSGKFSKVAAPKHPFDGKKLNTVRYELKGGHRAEIGFSKVGDHYYDPNWAADMLERRQKGQDGLWVLSDEDQFYSILYHSLVRWPGAEKQAHKPTLSRLAPKIGVKYSSHGNNNNEEMKKTLQAFMTQHNYTFTDPFHEKPGTPTKYMKLKAIPSLGEVSKPQCKITHFIHIGKTGGSTVKAWLQQSYPGIKHDYKDKYLKEEDGNTVQLSRWNFNETRFLLHGHGFRLGDGGPHDCYVTFVRDPLERWVSGFLSRARKASNHNGDEHWSSKERNVYTHYKTPEALAQALGSNHSGKRKEALKANNDLHHTKEGIAWYLPHIEKHMDRILFVGDTHTLDKDFKRMCEASGLPAGQPLLDLHAHNAIPAKQEHLKLLTPEAEEKLRLFLEPEYAALDKLAKHGLLTINNNEDAVTGSDDDHASGIQNLFSLLVDREDDEDAV